MFVVIIPAYKPDGTLTELIEKLESFDVEKIVVDDGSGSEYEDVFRTVEDRCILLRHEKNRGKGAAVKTGLSEVKEMRGQIEAVGIMDSDGQHLPEDMMKLLAAASVNKKALILGGKAGRAKDASEIEDRKHCNQRSLPPGDRHGSIRYSDRAQSLFS